MRRRAAISGSGSRPRANPRAAMLAVRALVLANCALAAAWLGGVSGIGTATRTVTLLSCVAIVLVSVREHPELHRGGLNGRLAVRLTLATAFVLAGVIGFTLIFR